MADRCFYFGCWGEPGHFLRATDGSTVARAERNNVQYDDGHIDGALAPRVDRHWAVVFGRSGEAECAQGLFLRHVLRNGFTAIQWWDRCQGDTRPASNSTILLAGERTTEEMLSALREHFPSVLANLTKAGVELREVLSLGTLPHGTRFSFASGYIRGVWIVGKPDKPGDTAPRCVMEGSAGATNKPFSPDCMVIVEGGYDD